MRGFLLEGGRMIVTVDLPYARRKFVCNICGHSSFHMDNMRDCESTPMENVRVAARLKESVRLRGEGQPDKVCNVKEIFFTVPHWCLDKAPLPLHTAVVRFTHKGKHEYMKYRDFASQIAQ